MVSRWKKTTWRVKLLAIILLVVVFYVGFRLGGQKKEIKTDNAVTSQKQVTTNPALISISIKDIKEENFIGKIPVISGSSVLSVKAREYVDATIADFRTQANTDVPAMRKEFGANAPTASYEIDIDAKYIKNTKTSSIVMTIYTYTGGANGNNVYKVFTADNITGKILSLSDVIKKDQQNNFVAFLKMQLNNWRPEGSTAPVVFPDEVKNLKFDSLTNWSLNDKNLIIYFAKYDIGPGVLGAVAFPLSLDKIKNFLII